MHVYPLIVVLLLIAVPALGQPIDSSGVVVRPDIGGALSILADACQEDSALHGAYPVRLEWEGGVATLAALVDSDADVLQAAKLEALAKRAMPGYKVRVVVAHRLPLQRFARAIDSAVDSTLGSRGNSVSGAFYKKNEPGTGTIQIQLFGARVRPGGDTEPVADSNDPVAKIANEIKLQSEFCAAMRDKAELRRVLGDAYVDLAVIAKFVRPKAITLSARSRAALREIRREILENEELHGAWVDVCHRYSLADKPSGHLVWIVYDPQASLSQRDAIHQLLAERLRVYEVRTEVTFPLRALIAQSRKKLSTPPAEARRNVRGALYQAVTINDSLDPVADQLAIVPFGVVESMERKEAVLRSLHDALDATSDWYDYSQMRPAGPAMPFTVEGSRTRVFEVSPAYVTHSQAVQRYVSRGRGSHGVLVRLRECRDHLNRLCGYDAVVATERSVSKGHLTQLLTAELGIPISVVSVETLPFDSVLHRSGLLVEGNRSLGGCELTGGLFGIHQSQERVFPVLHLEGRVTDSSRARHVGNLVAMEFKKIAEWKPWLDYDNYGFVDIGLLDRRRGSAEVAERLAHLAHARFRSGAYWEAERVFRQASVESPYDHRARYWRIASIIKQGDLHRAAEHMLAASTFSRGSYWDGDVQRSLMRFQGYDRVAMNRLEAVSRTGNSGLAATVARPVQPTATYCAVCE